MTPVEPGFLANTFDISYATDEDSRNLKACVSVGVGRKSLTADHGGAVKPDAETTPSAKYLEVTSAPAAKA